MKIIESNGLIELQADKGKVITTLANSSLRVKLVCTNKQNVKNFIEVDEEPQINISYEPDLEQPEEKLNGLTLVDAYYQLLNENRTLKEENKKQGELINEIKTTVDEMFTMIEPLICK